MRDTTSQWTCEQTFSNAFSFCSAFVGCEGYAGKKKPLKYPDPDAAVQINDPVVKYLENRKTPFCRWHAQSKGLEVGKFGIWNVLPGSLALAEHSAMAGRLQDLFSAIPNSTPSAVELQYGGLWLR